MKVSFAVVPTDVLTHDFELIIHTLEQHPDAPPPLIEQGEELFVQIKEELVKREVITIH